MQSPAIVAALEAAVHRVLDHLAAELADLGLRQAEINVLAQLGPRAPRPVGELVAATGQRPSTLTGVLDRLEGRGLVRRQVNAADRRSFTIGLTAAGEVAAGRVREAFDAVDARVRDAVAPADLEGFQRVLDAVERQTSGPT